MNNSQLLVLLTFAGSSTLLLSWIFQNYFSKKWEGQISDSKERMAIITTFANSHDLYSFQMYLFQSIASENTNPRNTNNFLRSLQQYLINLVEMKTQIQYNLAMDKEKYAKSFSEEAEEMEKQRINEINQKFINSDVSGLIDLASEYAQENDGTFENQATEILAFLRKMSKKKKRFNNFHLINYIIGTILLAIAASLKIVLSGHSA